MSLIKIENKLNLKEIKEMLDEKEMDTVLCILRLARDKAPNDFWVLKDELCKIYDINPNLI